MDVAGRKIEGPQSVAMDCGNGVGWFVFAADLPVNPKGSEYGQLAMLNCRFGTAWGERYDNGGHTVA